MGIIREGLGETVVILNRNGYEMKMQLIDDMYLVDLAKERQDEPCSVFKWIQVV